MGRPPHSGRMTTEQCAAISVKLLNQYHCFDGGIRSGTMNWTRNGETGSINFMVSTDEGHEHICLEYTHTNFSSGEITFLDYQVQLASTPCHFGGRRWWFVCMDCDRRVGLLYLANGEYFLCRHCHDLTYISQKESHSFDRMFLRMGVDRKIGRQLFKNRF